MLRWKFAGLMLFASLAQAASVDIDLAQARITYFSADSSPPNTRTQVAQLGDLELFNYDGAFPGDARGRGSVFYSFQPHNGGFQLFVQASHETFNEPQGAGGNAAFTLSFISDVDLKFTFEAGVTSPPAFFSGIIQPINATAQFAGNNTWTGAIPHTTDNEGNVEFDLFIEEGIIPAGKAPFLSVDANTFPSSFGNPSKSEGFVRFHVEPVANPIPLPPAAWPALMCLAAGAPVMRRKMFF